MHRAKTWKARKSLGQNFLIDTAILEAILQVSKPSLQDSLLEIGPGPGSLSEYLIPKVNRYIAIEKDRRFCSYLGKKYQDVQIIEAEAQHFDYQSLGKGPFKVVANLPYNVATPIILKLLSYPKLFSQGLFLMVQKEVAQRLCASPCTKAYSSLSLLIQLQAKADCLFDISPKSFHPPPKVTSSFVRLIPHLQTPLILEQSFQFFLGQCFKQKRKTLWNNLKDYYPIQRLQLAWDTLSLQNHVRSEQLPASIFIQFYGLLKDLIKDSNTNKLIKPTANNSEGGR